MTNFEQITTLIDTMLTHSIEDKPFHLTSPDNNYTAYQVQNYHDQGLMEGSYPGIVASWHEFARRLAMSPTIATQGVEVTPGITQGTVLCRNEVVGIIYIRAIEHERVHLLTITDGQVAAPLIGVFILFSFVEWQDDYRSLLDSLPKLKSIVPLKDGNRLQIRTEYPPRLRTLMHIKNQHLEWGAKEVADEYEQQTGHHISEDTVYKDYKDNNVEWPKRGGRNR